MKNRQVNATEFKARCLALLDEVEERRSTITVTKRGRPVAAMIAVKTRPVKSTRGILARKGRVVGDIVNFQMDWDVLRERQA